ncbi:MAG: hypothetical protein AAGE99_03265 [Chlamydiota bacterium]
MSTSVESDHASSGMIEESPFRWGAEVPEELREEASSVSKLAFDLFQKLKIHPNVYVPCGKDNSKNWCWFFWTNNRGQDGAIYLNRYIKMEKGKKKELPLINVQIRHQRDISISPFVTGVTFIEAKRESEYTTMPVELRKEAENLIKVSSLFFRKLVRHSIVTTTDGGLNIADWERFRCYNEKGYPYGSIAFSDRIHDHDRTQHLNFQRH